MAISSLTAGFESFHALHYEKREGALFNKLVTEGQKPKVLMISCSDSRVDPAILFNSDPGEIFVVRNVAAIAPPYAPEGSRESEKHGVGAAIEFAVRDLKVEHIVVMGHAHCGGVAALAAMRDGATIERDYIGPWVSIMEDAISDHPSGCAAHMNEHSVVSQSKKNLMTYPWIKERVENGDLHLHAWWFDLDKGRLMKEGDETPDFVDLA